MHDESAATPLREGLDDSFVQDAFTAAALSYRDPALGADRLSEGWQSIAPPANLREDFATSNCDHFVSPKGDHFISFRGTTDLTDWTNNLGQGSTAYRPQYDAAARIAEHFRDTRDTPGNDFNVTYTGHSLGGGKAQLAAEVASLAPRDRNAQSEPQVCVAINAAPVHRETYRAHGCDEHRHAATILEIENEHDALTLARDFTPTLAGTIVQGANFGVVAALDHTPGVVKSAASLGVSGAVAVGSAAKTAAGNAKALGVEAARSGMNAASDIGTGVMNAGTSVANAGVAAAKSGAQTIGTGAYAVAQVAAKAPGALASGVGAVGGALKSGAAYATPAFVSNLYAWATAGTGGPPSTLGLYVAQAKAAVAQGATAAYDVAAKAGDIGYQAATATKDAARSAATSGKDAAVWAASTSKDAVGAIASASKDATIAAASQLGNAALDVGATAARATVGAVGTVGGVAKAVADKTYVTQATNAAATAIMDASGASAINARRAMGDRVQIKLAGNGAVLSRDPASGHYMSSFDQRDPAERGKAPRITAEVDRIESFGALQSFDVGSPGVKNLRDLDTFKPPAQRLLAAAVGANSQGEHALQHANDRSQGRS